MPASAKVQSIQPANDPASNMAEIVSWALEAAWNRRALSCEMQAAAYVARAFAGRTATIEDTRKPYPEIRFSTMGLLDDRRPGGRVN